MPDIDHTSETICIAKEIVINVTDMGIYYIFFWEK